MQNFIVYKSSAGSGKTFTLVKEYLRLALHDETKLSYNFKKILAVTFTNKAAAEMKKRVLDALKEIVAKEKLPDLGLVLLQELNVSEEQLRGRCIVVLDSILHHYADFSIGTIDSFTHKIVKTFSHDLDLPANFTVELDIRSFYERVISQLLSRIGEDEYISKLLKEYVLEKAEESANWDPERQILEFSQLLEKEDSTRHLNLLRKFSATDFEEFRKEFIGFMRHYTSTLKQHASEALNLISDYNIPDDAFRYKKSGAQSFFKKCLANTVTDEDTGKKHIHEAIHENKWSGTNNEALLTIAPRLREIAVTLVDFVNGNYRYYSLCRLLTRQLYPLMLLKKIEELTEEEKQENRLVFISEFNERIHDIIHNEPAPFIYERMGERYNHYLLDEFQDTSTMQWLNIMPLIDNSLSSGWFNLLVGDGKQSIYRWRNANVRQFADLPKVDNPANQPLLAERAATLERNFGKRLLNTNYRSLATIVSFNNDFFAFMKTRLSDLHSLFALSGIYDEHEQLIKRAEKGLVTLDNRLVERDELDATTIALVKEHITNALASGFSRRDCCILTRTNTQGSTIAIGLMVEGIPVVSSESLLLKNSSEVNTLVCFLSYLANTDDRVSAAVVLNYLHVTGMLSQEELHNDLRLLKVQGLQKILASHGIPLDTGSLALNNLFDICVEATRALHLEKRGQLYIRFFLDEVNEFLVMQNGSLPAFLEWWEKKQQKASLVIPDTTDAVKIMTLHSSKGLEFPVVIIPYCTWPYFRVGDAWVSVEDERIKLPVGLIKLTKNAAESGFGMELESEQIAQVVDNLNLLYVAFTRAVERLHIITTRSKSNRLPQVGDWVEDFFASGNAQFENDRYTLGSSNKKIPQKEKSHLAYNLKPIEFTSSDHSIRIKSSYQRDTEIDERLASDAREEGIVLHWLLSKTEKEEDIQGSISEGLRKGLFNESDDSRFRSRLMEVIAHPALARFFTGELHARREAELITAEGEVLRPDLVISGKDETVVIDYKTGSKRREHVTQLQQYENALSQMGYANIKKLLVYVDPLDVVEVK